MRKRDRAFQPEIARNLSDVRGKLAEWETRCREFAEVAGVVLNDEDKTHIARRICSGATGLHEHLHKEWGRISTSYNIVEQEIN